MLERNRLSLCACCSPRWRISSRAWTCREKSTRLWPQIRELLLLAATEAEASWAAILKANRYPPKDRLNTTDYVKLLDPMLLDSYTLSLASYPDFPAFAPLKGWDPKRPTQSLDWYDAYNATKHNREEHLDVATLERVIHAVGATVVMFFAQFGWGSSLLERCQSFFDPPCLHRGI